MGLEKLLSRISANKFKCEFKKDYDPITYLLLYCLLIKHQWNEKKRIDIPICFSHSKQAKNNKSSFWELLVPTHSFSNSVYLLVTKGSFNNYVGQILPPKPLKWTIVDILHTTYYPLITCPIVDFLPLSTTSCLCSIERPPTLILLCHKNQQIK